MRKADYAALADIIRTEHDKAMSEIHHAEDSEMRRLGTARKFMCVRIARAFTDRASVDRTEFLKACGIDP